jgi:hypothetical protein
MYSHLDRPGATVSLVSYFEHQDLHPIQVFVPQFHDTQIMLRWCSFLWGYEDGDGPLDITIQ